MDGTALLQHAANQSSIASNKTKNKNSLSGKEGQKHTFFCRVSGCKKTGPFKNCLALRHHLGSVHYKQRHGSSVTTKPHQTKESPKSEESVKKKDQVCEPPVVAVIDLDDSMYDEVSESCVDFSNTLERVDYILKQCGKVKQENTDSFRMDEEPIAQLCESHEQSTAVPNVVQNELRKTRISAVEIPHPRFSEDFKLPQLRLSETQLEDISCPSLFLQNTSTFGQPLKCSSLIDRSSQSVVQPNGRVTDPFRKPTIPEQRLPTLVEGNPLDPPLEPLVAEWIKTEQSTMFSNDVTIPSQYLGDTTMFRDQLIQGNLDLIDELFPSRILQQNLCSDTQKTNVAVSQEARQKTSNQDDVTAPQLNPAISGSQTAQSALDVPAIQAQENPTQGNSPAALIHEQPPAAAKSVVSPGINVGAAPDVMPAIQRNILSNILNTLEARPQDFEKLDPVLGKGLLVNSIEKTIHTLKAMEPQLPSVSNAVPVIPVVPVAAEPQPMYVTINININSVEKRISSSAPAQPPPEPVPPYEGVVIDHDQLFDGNFCLLHKKAITNVVQHKNTKVHSIVEALIKGGEQKTKLSIQDMRDLFDPEPTVRRCCLCGLKFENQTLFKSHMKSPIHSACLALYSAPTAIDTDPVAEPVTAFQPHEEENRRRKQTNERVGKPPKRVRRVPRPRLPPSVICISDEEGDASVDYTLD